MSGEWIDVTPIRGSFAVNIGDVLEAWTEHMASQKEGAKKLRATPHRVFNKSNERNRLSMAFFYEPSLEMRTPDGVALKREGTRDVNTYGEHVYRAYASSYPELAELAQ